MEHYDRVRTMYLRAAPRAEELQVGLVVYAVDCRIFHPFPSNITCAWMGLPSLAGFRGRAMYEFLDTLVFSPGWSGVRWHVSGAGDQRVVDVFAGLYDHRGVDTRWVSNVSFVIDEWELKQMLPGGVI